MGACTSNPDGDDTFIMDLQVELEQTREDWISGEAMNIEGWKGKDGLGWKSRASFDPTSGKGKTESQNQDFCQCWPAWDGNEAQVLNVVMDGHGKQGELFSEEATLILEERLRTHPKLYSDTRQAYNVFACSPNP